ncbi:hypothetical protein O5O45_12250 [Hahella aquimaris]|nr:hypothetical protein [Hahella sp. HNIBRBA332]WLQ16691.1 hypothetical protein O5O45_12250 [Hahella sp. HNIBRBA332]
MAQYASAHRQRYASDDCRAAMSRARRINYIEIVLRNGPIQMHLYWLNTRMIDPVFANITSNKDLDQITLRSKAKAMAQWLNGSMANVLNGTQYREDVAVWVKQLYRLN